MTGTIVKVRNAHCCGGRNWGGGGGGGGRTFKALVKSRVE